MNPGSDAQKQQLLFAPCTNKNDPSKTMPASREFETENTEGYIEEGKKVAKKKRSFIITGLGLPFVDATDSGWPAVSHPVMTKIVGDPPEKYGSLVGMFEEKGLKGGKEACEALAAAVESSKIDTLIGTFMVPLAEFADAGSRIHCSLNINTETGRLSSRKPNLQNQPAHDKDRFGIRKAFTCEPGNNLIVADYGQLELRLLAHMTNCKSMIEAFRSGGDFHSRTALGMYPHVRQAIDEGKVLLEWDGAKGKAPLPLLKDEFGTERRRAKTLNFSIAYGKTVMGLAKDWSVSPEEARETLDRWYADRPEVKTWQEKTIARAHVTGWTRTLLGRYRPLPEINSRERTRRSHSERAAINTPLQGGAADITTRAMILLHQHERLRQLGWYQLLQIHDELILEGPKESTEEAMSIVVNVMSNPLPEPLLVDLVVDAKSATTWYEAK
jgi:DNA polymerase-1